MGGSSKKQTVGYRYRMGLHLVLCQGPVDAVQEIQMGDRTSWGDADRAPLSSGHGLTSISINKPDLFGGDDREGQQADRGRQQAELVRVDAERRLEPALDPAVQQEACDERHDAEDDQRHGHDERRLVRVLVLSPLSCMIYTSSLDLAGSLPCCRCLNSIGSSAPRRDVLHSGCVAYSACVSRASRVRCA